MISICCFIITGYILNDISNGILNRIDIVSDDSNKTFWWFVGILLWLIHYWLYIVAAHDGDEFLNMVSNRGNIRVIGDISNRETSNERTHLL